MIVGESVSVRAYVAACATLLALTALTLVLAHVDLRGWNTVVGLAIAAVKALVIVSIFMHLKVRGSAMSRVVAVAAIVWLSILLLGTLDDFLTREWLATAGK